MRRGLTALQQGILDDVVERPPLRPPSVQWAPVSAYREELRRWMLDGIAPEVMREWVEPDARPAFDALLEELLERAGSVVGAFTRVGLRHRVRDLRRVDQATSAMTKGPKAAKKKRDRARAGKAKNWGEDVKRLRTMRGWGAARIAKFLKDQHNGEGPSRRLVEHIIARSRS